MRVFGHRHTGEILEQLRLGGQRIDLHAAPVAHSARILSTIYVHLNRGDESRADVEACFREFYAGKAMGADFCAAALAGDSVFSRIPIIAISVSALAEDGRRLMLVSCVDNLLKGAAGQAVQNMNLMYGWKEEEGLQ